MRMLLTLAALLSIAAPAAAGKYNPTVDIGDAAPDWKGLPGTDGKRHSLSDFAQRDVVVVAFTCNSCPYAVDYEGRIIELVKKYQGQSVALIAVNVNTIEADRLPAMKERAEEKGFNFPYVFDETQKLARAYGATTTPEFFVLNKQRKIVYMGALDDSPKQANVKTRHLQLAIDAALQGQQPPVAETVPIGCRVRFERVRRTRRKESAPSD